MPGKTTASTGEQCLLVCNCQKTMQIDGARLAQGLGRGSPVVVHHELCRSQVGQFEAALADGGPVQVACTQEAPLFREVAGEKGANNALTFTNIRERAGWTSAKDGALSKMAALLAEAAFEAKPAGVTTLKSDGVCLVYGRGQEALDVAAELSGRLSVSVLLADAAGAMPPSSNAVPIAKGRIKTARGTLGRFEIEVDGYAPALPSSRKALDFAMARNGARSTCDLILDITGDRPLFSDIQRRDGYLRADPAQPGAVARIMLKATDLVGEFEKPLYVSLDPAICAHARSQKVGCTNCLDNCPTGAITPAGDHVAIEAAICGGCGNCSAVCPTGAISYAYPQRADTMTRIEILLRTYAAAKGTRPVLLLHDEAHGSGLIAAMARLGRGLPANVLPLSLFSVTQLGHETMLGTLAFGAERIVVLASPEHPEELAALQTQAALATALVGGLDIKGARIEISTERDPEAVEALLYAATALTALPFASFNVLGAKRELVRTALGRLKGLGGSAPDTIALPKGAPYGRIHVDTAGCTLCLSCVGACPANALSDHPEKPQLAFTEAACVQCGICVATCPEKVITLEPRYNLQAAAMSPEVVKAEEPFHCVSCGKAFGTRSTIERVLARLEGKHAMFQTSAQARLIQMCDTCRITAMSEVADNPFKSADRPRMRTTEDYLAEAKAERDSGTVPGAQRKPEDFLN